MRKINGHPFADMLCQALVPIPKRSFLLFTNLAVRHYSCKTLNGHKSNRTINSLLHITSYSSYYRRMRWASILHFILRAKKWRAKNHKKTKKKGKKQEKNLKKKKNENCEVGDILLLYFALLFVWCVFIYFLSQRIGLGLVSGPVECKGWFVRNIVMAEKGLHG